MRRFLLLAIMVTISLMANLAYGAALTEGEIYIIELDAINSNGTIADLTYSTTATADSNLKLSFSFSGIPNQDSYNFLLVTIIDSSNVTVRRSIIPAPAAGGTTNLGVSPMTEAQTEAMISAMATAGTDDPIMILFGSVIIRSGGFTTDDITHLANLGRLGIQSGFNVYLLDKIGATKMATFRSAIVSRLGDYTTNLKESVDAESSTDSKDERAEAAALLSQILIEAAAEADFELGYINAAMKSASDQVEVYLGGDGSGMNEAAVSAMDSVMFSNYMKLSAERVRKKYTTALTALSADPDQVTRLNTAITTLSDSLLSAFQEFEDVFADEEASLDNDAIDSAFSEIDSVMQTAFAQFISDSASSNDEIDDMISSMVSGFGIDESVLNTLRGAAATDANDKEYYDGVFTFYEMGGNKYNWPITMVVPVTWVADNHGNDFSYTRDDLEVPGAAEWISNQTRTDFTGGDFAEMTAGMAALFGLREDIEIIMARKWAGLSAASKDMTQAGYATLSTSDKTTADNYIDAGTLESLLTSEDTAAEDDAAGVDLTGFTIIEDLSPYLTGAESQGLEDLVITRFEARKDDIGPTTITAAQKDALIVTGTMPDFH